MAPNARWALGGGRRKGRIEGSESLRKAGGSREALPPTKKTGTMACEEHSNRCARSTAIAYRKIAVMHVKGRGVPSLSEAPSSVAGWVRFRHRRVQTQGSD